MPLQIYNSLTRQKETFKPIHEGRVNIYVCGPTVYSHAHVGHAKSYISFDVIIRYFRYLGYRVKYVQNITDVGHLTDNADAGEDKISKQARKEQLDPMAVAEHYTWSYFDDMDALGVARPDITPRATGHIIEQINMIEALIEKGFAYEVNGSVYFDVNKYSEQADYGQLSGRKIDELEAGARLEIIKEKRHPADFALWKKADPSHLMQWPSPWGKGYPGWHIECSAMSMKYLGETFDIHGGGLDNIFPHHECEIAQSMAYSGKPFANYWLHNNMISVNGEKMGKSLGNFILIKDALAKYSAETLRYFMLSSHYRSRLDYSDSAVQAAEQGLKRLNATVASLQSAAENATDIADFKAPFDASVFRQRFEDAMNDDFNTSMAMAVLFELGKATKAYLSENDSHDRSFLVSINDIFKELGGDLLGILSDEQAAAGDSEVLKQVIDLHIEIRNQIRKEKNWALSDQIRDRLKEAGVILADKPDGTTDWQIDK